MPDASDHRDPVLRFFSSDGRLRAMPSRRGKRLPVLDRVAREFEPGRVYPEAQVDAILKRIHDDHAALRRHLVDEAFLTRRDNHYWRTRGSVEP